MPALHELYFHDVRLKQLHLQNFRGFGYVELDFHPDKPVTVLIADNGGGKSTVLDAAAEFLRYFFQLAIAGQNEEGASKETFLGEKDIFNGRNNASASAVLNLSYPYPDKEIFEWMDDCARYLDEHSVQGEEAILALEGEIWTLQLKQQEEFITYYLPDELQNVPKDLVKITNEIVDFKVTMHSNQQWNPTLLSAPLWRETKLEFELTRAQIAPMKFTAPSSKPEIHTDFITTWEKYEGFISDYAYSASRYNRHNPVDESLVVLPLLAYYGGAAINAKYDNELKVPYRPGEFQAYSHALEPERFEFEEFITWALWVSEKQQNAWDVVKNTILDVMNADQGSARYETIQIEAQTLVFYKKTGVDVMPVEAAQLSAGEKNIMALVGDLAKRAVQLNAILFKVDYDNEKGILSNPLQHTPGIVLIDEIDLHLHPRWQRVIIPKLREHFPRVQFVVTTHSPFVVQSVPADNRLIIDKNQIVVLNRQTELSYETIVNDYFGNVKLFDDDSEKLIEILIEFKNKILNNEIKITDNDFLKVLKKISTKSDEIKAIAAREIRILNNAILENGKNK